MQHQRKLWPLAGVMSVMLFSLPTMGFSQIRETQGTKVESRDTATNGATGIDEPPLTGSGGMNEEDRTGATGPSGTRSTSSLNTGAIDTLGRVTKSAGDEAVTENDRALVSQARVALAGNPNINPAEGAVHLKADNGVIQLFGWTGSEQERTAMAETIGSLKGVQGVENHLQVRPGALGAAR